MKVQATLKNYRRSSKKVVETARLLKGLDCQEALTQLRHIDRKDAEILIKLIKSAMANAENNFGLDKNNLYVYQVMIGEGATMKRWRPRAFGRAAAILKRTCQLTVVLDERKPTAAKKSAKPKTEPAKENKGEKEEDKPTEKTKNQEKGFSKDSQNIKGKAAQSGFGKKVFRRKSA